MKSYKKGFIFLEVKEVKDLLKLAKMFSQEPILQFIPMFPSIPETSRLVRNFPPQ